MLKVILPVLNAKREKVITISHGYSVFINTFQINVKNSLPSKSFLSGLEFVIFNPNSGPGVTRDTPFSEGLIKYYNILKFNQNHWSRFQTTEVATSLM